MPGRLAKMIDGWRLGKVQAHWEAAAEQAATLAPAALRRLRAQAVAIRRPIDRVIRQADARFALPPIGAALPRLPLGTDWSWRPDAWRGPMATPGLVATETRAPVSDDVEAFHDCPLGEIALRQVRSTVERDTAPFGLALDVFGFHGSFLSLALTMPPEAVQGLKTRHLLRLDATVEADRPVKALARLNIKHGTQTAQIALDLPVQGRTEVLEFDLAYARLDDAKIENAWLDLIFKDAAQARILIKDIVVSRRPRAEL
jgi:Family of unknown function (DUF6478)